MEFGNDLMLLADKFYYELTLMAREHFALNQYFSQLTDPQVSFNVKQT